MASFLQGKDVRLINLGRLVTKAATAFPQTATSTLYTIAGGNVLVTSFFGIVSTVVASTDPQLSLGIAATGATASTTSLATSVALTSREVGTWVGLTNTSQKGGALLVGTNGSTVLFSQAAFPVAPGVIEQTTQASETGAISWYLTYIPLDDGASVS